MEISIRFHEMELYGSNETFKLGFHIVKGMLIDNR